jgi:hypothetical protein
MDYGQAQMLLIQEYEKSLGETPRIEDRTRALLILNQLERSVRESNRFRSTDQLNAWALGTAKQFLFVPELMGLPKEQILVTMKNVVEYLIKWEGTTIEVAVEEEQTTVRFYRPEGWFWRLFGWPKRLFLGDAPMQYFFPSS